MLVSARYLLQMLRSLVGTTLKFSLAQHFRQLQGVKRTCDHHALSDHVAEDIIGGDDCGSARPLRCYQRNSPAKPERNVQEAKEITWGTCAKPVMGAEIFVTAKGVTQHKDSVITLRVRSIN